MTEEMAIVFYRQSSWGNKDSWHTMFDLGWGKNLQFNRTKNSNIIAALT